MRPLRAAYLAAAAFAISLLLFGGGTSVGRTVCSLTVEPRTGPPGTQFVFTGAGFGMTRLTLTRDRETPRTVAVAAAGDPSTVRLIAGGGDIGRWRASGEGCGSATSFRVTEAAAAMPLSPQANGSDDPVAPVAFLLLGLLLVVLLVGSGALLLPRLARSLGSR